MDPTSDSPAVVIYDLYTLTLVDGLPTQMEGKTIRYRTVKLRETTVADERRAQRLAERVVMVGGVAKLLVSDADFRYALTMQHIEALACDTWKITGAVIDLDLLGKLTSHDLGLIEQRVFLITLAAEVRYGNMTQAKFDEVMAGGAGSGNGNQSTPTPQPVGQAADMGQAAAPSEPGPALLADYAGSTAGGAPAGDGR